NAIEGAVEHTHDVAGLVVDDTPCFPVEEQRRRRAAGGLWIVYEINFVQSARTVDCVGYDTWPRIECPPALGHQPVSDRQRDHVGEPFELAHDEGAMGPRARVRNVQVIAARLGCESAFTCRPCAPVRCDPIAILRLPAHEPTARRVGVVPMVLPLALYQHAHDPAPSKCLTAGTDRTPKRSR